MTAETIPIPNEFDDDFWSHPIYTNYESNRNGIIRNVKFKKLVGYLTNRGYYTVTVIDNGQKKILGVIVLSMSVFMG